MNFRNDHLKQEQKKNYLGTWALSNTVKEINYEFYINLQEDQ